MVILDCDEQGERKQLEFVVVKRVRLGEETHWDRLVEGGKPFCRRKHNKCLSEFKHLVIKSSQKRKLQHYHSWADKRKQSRSSERMACAELCRKSSFTEVELWLGSFRRKEYCDNWKMGGTEGTEKEKCGAKRCRTTRVKNSLTCFNTIGRRFLNAHVLEWFCIACCLTGREPLFF